MGKKNFMGKLFGKSKKNFWKKIGGKVPPVNEGKY